MKGPLGYMMVAIALAGFVAAGCAPAAPAAPTQAPAAPAPAAPTKAPAAAPAAPTSAPQAAQPTAAPAKKVDFPTKGSTITLVSTTASGTSFAAAQTLAAGMQKELGVAVSIDPKEGANGQLAYTAVSKAKPDGYTLSDYSLPVLALTYLDPSRKATYTRKDFVPVANYTTFAAGLAVRSDSKYKTAKDLMDDAKAHPSTIRVGTTGATAFTYMALLAFEKSTGIKFRYVHFNGSGPLLTALLGGQVDVGASASSVYVAPSKNGDVRVLGVMAPDETHFLPGVKTFKEQGYDLLSETCGGYIAPAGTPRDVVDILSASVKKAMENDDVKKAMEAAALDQKYMNPDELAAYWTDAEARAKAAFDAASAATK